MTWVRRPMMVKPTVIAPQGELDIHAVQTLAPKLNEAAGGDYPHLILDLSAVTLVDSSAFGAIMHAQSRFTGQGRRC